MANRSVKVILEAQVSGFVANMKRAQAATADLAKSTAKMSQDHKASWDKMSSGLMLGGAGVVAAIGGIAKVGMDFEKSMSGVKAVANASGAEMEALSAKAKQLGADTSFSASEAAAAEAELAKAGVSVADILGGALKGSMDLAAAGQIDLAKSAEISAQAMNIFGLRGSDVSHIADVLAAAANKSATDVGDLGMGLSQAGTVAKQTGLSLEDTAASLALFADNGMKGSDAGTSLKTMLMRLTPTSKEAQKVMDDLGLSFFDANGQFVGMDEASRRLSAAMSGLTDEQRNVALATIFGSDATRAANILLDSQSEKAKSAGKTWADYRVAVNDAGAAGRMAATQLDNLAGDWEKLMGSLETAALNGSGGLTAGLRSIVQQATGVVDALGDIPEPIAEIGVQAGLSVGGLALMAGGLMKGVSAGQEAYDSFKRLSEQAPKTAKAVKGLGIAMAALAAVQFATQIVSQMTEVEISAEEMVNRVSVQMDDLEGVLEGTQSSKWFSFGEGLNNIDEVNAALNKLGDNSGLAKFSRSVDSMWAGWFGDAAKADYQHIADGLERTGDALATIATSDLPKAQDAFKRFYDQLDPTSRTHLLDAMPAYKQYLYELANQTGINADETTILKMATGELVTGMIHATGAAGDAKDGMSGAGKAIDGMGDKAKETAPTIQDIVKGLNALGAAGRGLWGAEDSVEAAIDGVTESLKENGRTLDKTTEAGRANRGALSDLAGSYTGLMAAQAEAGKSSDVIARTWQQGHDKLIKMLSLFGIVGPKAEAIATELLGTRDAAIASAKGVDGLGDSADAVNGKSAVVKAGVDGLPAAKQQVDLFGDSIGSVPPSLRPVVEAPGAVAARSEILNVTAAANGVPPSIAAVTTAPGAVTATGQLWSTTSAAQAVDAQAPVVTTSTNAPTTTGLLYGTSNAAGVVDAQSPNVGVTTNAWSATSALYGTNAAANAIDGKVVSITVALRGVSSAAATLASWGGLHTGGDFTAHAAGGDHWQDSKGRRYPRTKPLLMGRMTGITDVIGPAFGAGESFLDWETYISSDPRYRKENKQYAQDAVGRLGGVVTWHEAGARYTPAPLASTPVAVGSSGVSPQQMAVLLEAHADRIVKAVRDAGRTTDTRAAQQVRQGLAAIGGRRG